MGGTLPDAILLLLESEIWLPDLGKFFNGGNYYICGNYYKELLTFIDLLVWELFRLCYMDSTLSSSSFDFCYRWLIWVDKIRSLVTRGLRESDDFMLDLRAFGLTGFLEAYDIIGLWGALYSFIIMLFLLFFLYLTLWVFLKSLFTDSGMYVSEIRILYTAFL